MKESFNERIAVNLMCKQKLLTTMLPTPEEKHKIQEATNCNPYLPLGSAEQFFMMLSSISELSARLKRWNFKLDYENMEKIGSITRASKVGFEELSNNIAKIEVDCKESWDHLKAIAKHDGPMQIKLKVSCIVLCFSMLFPLF
ncbi:FH1/FH2 domain-containing protein 3-like [Cherax quadricarinatus]|uniref:FH1/FH2 domain-containing protein 3-like n=1 Tax=Cherax quadricarinatus TaxID=27406 RepID=UPI00387EBA4A